MSEIINVCLVETAEIEVIYINSLVELYLLNMY